MSDRELIEVLRRTKELFGPLYPVLVAPDGSVIDGLHRLEADPDWPRVTVDWLTNPVDAKALRIIANVVRREVSAEEKAEALGALIEMTGWKPKELAEALGMSYRWVMKYLPDKYKERPGAGGPKRVLRRRTQEEAPEAGGPKVAARRAAREVSKRVARRATQEEAPEAKAVIPESSKVPEDAVEEPKREVPKAVTRLPEKSKEPSLEEKARDLGGDYNTCYNGQQSCLLPG